MLELLILVILVKIVVSSNVFLFQEVCNNISQAVLTVRAPALDFDTIDPIVRR